MTIIHQQTQQSQAIQQNIVENLCFMVENRFKRIQS